MPYCNDLSDCADFITSEIQTGFGLGAYDAGKSAIAVSVFSETKSRKSPKIFRSSWTRDASGNISSSRSEVGDHSCASAATFKAFLFSTLVAPSGNYAIVILGHGGGVNEVCPDESSTSAGAMEWMDVVDLGNAIAEFALCVPGKLKFVYLQNCCKASLPALYAMGNLDSSVHVLASQTILGAPNSYYVALLRSMFVDPPSDGLDLAKRITRLDSPQYFAVLACFCVGSMSAYIQALDLFLKTALCVLNAQEIVILARIIKMLRVYMISYWTSAGIDRYVDAVGFCSIILDVSLEVLRNSEHSSALTNSLAEAYGQVNIAFEKFRCLLSISPSSNGYSHLCGLMLYFPFGGGSEDETNSRSVTTELRRRYPFANAARYMHTPSLCNLYDSLRSMVDIFKLFEVVEESYRKTYFDVDIVSDEHPELAKVVVQAGTDKTGAPTERTNKSFIPSKDKWVPSWQRK
jgi:hypothetical protein